jgi:hypothetical protein
VADRVRGRISPRVPERANRAISQPAPNAHARDASLDFGQHRL